MVIRQVSIGILLLIVSACSGFDIPNSDVPFPDPDQIADEYSVSQTLVVPMGVDYTYTAPNPGGRWEANGQTISLVGRYFTQIRVSITPKDPLQTLSDILPQLTARDYPIATEDDITYATGFNEIDVRVLFVDKGDFVVQLTLIDAVTDDIPQVYVDDLFTIGFQGDVFLFE
jgi:hypothetical protein